MPKLSKKALSLFVRTGCYRQFVLNLYNKVEREANGMAESQEARFALTGVAQQGNTWQFEKTNELITFYGKTNVLHGDVDLSRYTFEELELESELRNVLPFQFIVEADFQADTSTFKQMTGLAGLRDIKNVPLTIGNARPDLIQVLPALNDFEPLNYSDGFLSEVLHTGEAVEMDKTDIRKRLRIIDIKLASEPGAHYYTEVVYYSLALAAWLHDHSFDKQFAVVSTPAVWPGSHEASEIAKQMAEWKNLNYIPTNTDISHALERDFEIAPYEIFKPRLFHIFSVNVPHVLNNLWDTLDYHVTPRCKGCEFIGFPSLNKKGEETAKPLHCLPTTVRTNHLSRVPGLTGSGAKYLRSVNITDTLGLAQTPIDSSLFDSHQSLRAKRTTFPYRASELSNTISTIIPNSGGDALMPDWADLRIYLFLDYDLSSATSVAFSIRASWLEPQPFGVRFLDRKLLKWGSHDKDNGLEGAFVINKKSVHVEEKNEFIRFLHFLKNILDTVESEDNDAIRNGRRVNRSTYQIYFWDVSQQKHLIRLIGRHLAYIIVDPKIKNLAWLFPSPELLSHPEDAARNSPFTLVETVVSNTIAAPIPFHYNLMELVQHYHPIGVRPPLLTRFYEEPFSDLIPAERINEFWNPSPTTPLLIIQSSIIEAVQKKTRALDFIVSRLEADLKPILSKCAPILQRPDRSSAKLSNIPRSQMIYEFTRLNGALQRLETEVVRSMPPHERESKFKSARLTRRLDGHEKANAQSRFERLLGKKLPTDTIIYQLSVGSRDVNIKNGAINFHLSPESVPTFLDQKADKITYNTPVYQVYHSKHSVLKLNLTEVSVIAIDRGQGVIALQPGYQNQIDELERRGRIDLSANVILDHVANDFLSDKVDLTLRAIGNHPITNRDIATFNALGVTIKSPKVSKKPPKSKPAPPLPVAAEFLWDMNHLSKTPVSRNISTVEQYLKNLGLNLNSSQWTAWREALTKRASLIWGPPGTGKSKTLRAIILGAIQDAGSQDKPLRLLITANNYTAIDNVLLEVAKDLTTFLPTTPVNLSRVRSEFRTDEVMMGQHPKVDDLVLAKRSPSTEILNLLNSLNHPVGIVVVGATPGQLHNLAQVGAENIPINGKLPQNAPSDAQEREATIKSFFDLVLIDEASQLDVAMATLVFTKIASGGSCIMAGDHLQLPPIHHADPPENFESMLGSVYSYAFSNNVSRNSLEINYRSNRTMVELTKLADYDASLKSYSEDLKLNLLSSLPATQPADWQNELYWTTNWSEVANPDLSVVAFTYKDDVSSQINRFESDSIAAILWLYRSRLADSLKNQKDKNGIIKPDSNTLYSANDFWTKGVGIVTPHRAQRSLIVARLQEIFPYDIHELIDGAVDTVERFQGQERDIILASFGLGDPDLISGEEEFLFNKNRFNVLASRARAKLIVFATQTLVNHLPNDGDVLKESRFIKRFFESFCSQRKSLTLGYVDGSGNVVPQEGEMRFHS